ncbi:MAG: hypothetical protein HW408_393, partial [Actinobacteria bacterium]|nr:hypothetical protein [Actinomycetota bacterium]
AGLEMVMHGDGAGTFLKNRRKE